MQINWTIKKKRGNFRPYLKYTLILEDFEKKLAVNAVSIQSSIPVVPDSHSSTCMPGINERNPDWQPERFHYLSVPHFKRGEIEDFIRLPFRASNEYPEVEASFRQLRHAYEKVVRKAYGHEPMDTDGQLGITAETKSCIAARVTADRILSIFGQPDNEYVSEPVCRNAVLR